MYVVSKDLEPSTTNLHEYGAAYTLVGGPEEIAVFRRAAVSMLMGALACREVGDQQAFSLFRCLVSDQAILNRDREAFETIMLESNQYRFVRQRQQDIFTALKGTQIPLDGAVSESALLADQPLHPDHVTAIDERGLHGEFTENGFELSLHALEPDEGEHVLETWYGEDSVEVNFTRNCGLPVDTFVVQHPYVVDSEWLYQGRVTSAYEHTTLGITAADGNFEPLFTILDKNHPARAVPEPPIPVQA